ncbi:NAD(P)H-dependent oxidoreductase subunit E [Sporomusa acidovorans]|uniref:Respiratory-chain NADH dehydrogenase 24 Kd subunit n=1 Tax=Sporomusa acidovorans (strain ATCC 49682 / DSM 3132 / Mol) TaxID=1123286 RepID=A0ABZ3J683_SPOA4|nr:NAD(P)H-dependent oxidoreductase subunit E [Sporomusa acidovorans]OZC18477.1 NADP-reducing hydrogenase subunit HndA [Sporomusa acidovorans DSM 3132]SDE36086.1 Thioredoxin-like [2Fe-2S] ferredoxin [Sporomusa acidovorans]
MLTISICFGSKCQLRGASDVLNAFMVLIERYKIKSEIDIDGDFCQGKCTEGVVIKLNDEVITNVTKDKVHRILVEKVLKDIIMSPLNKS